MKRFKIGLAVLAALVTMSFTISRRLEIFAGSYSMESISCYKVLTISGVSYDAANAVQVPIQFTCGLKTINHYSVDVDLDPPNHKLASQQVNAIGSVRVRTCTIENVSNVCCFALNNGIPVEFATGIAATFF